MFHGGGDFYGRSELEQIVGHVSITPNPVKVAVRRYKLYATIQLDRYTHNREWPLAKRPAGMKVRPDQSESDVPINFPSCLAPVRKLNRTMF